jgi:hypothetical protein
MNTPVRLGELVFPQTDWLVARTRLAFIHLENVLSYAKRDRDGRVDGYLSAWLPNSVVLLFFRQGEAVNAAAMHDHGREVITIGEALKRLRAEIERADVAYAAAPMEQLAWMYQSCEKPPTPRWLDERQPAGLFPALRSEKFTGVLEFISNGRVNYLRCDAGKYVNGYLCAKPEQVTVAQYIESLFGSRSDGARSQLAANVFDPVADLPAQAPFQLIQTYHQLFWRVIDAVEKEMPGEGTKRGTKAAKSLTSQHPRLNIFSGPRAAEPPDAVVRPDELSVTLAEWTKQVLGEVDVIMPGTATKVLREATREHRYVLQSDGFYERLPWRVTW